LSVGMDGLSREEKAVPLAAHIFHPSTSLQMLQQTLEQLSADVDLLIDSVKSREELQCVETCFESWKRKIVSVKAGVNHPYEFVLNAMSAREPVSKEVKPQRRTVHQTSRRRQNSRTGRKSNQTSEAVNHINDSWLQEGLVATNDVRSVSDYQGQLVTYSDFVSDHTRRDVPQPQHIIMHVTRLPEPPIGSVTLLHGTLIRGPVAGLHGTVRGPVAELHGAAVEGPSGSNVAIAQDFVPSTVDVSGIGVQYGW